MQQRPHTPASILDAISTRLDGRRTDDGIICKCPAHHDEKASLSVTIASSGKLIWHCHAGCDWKHVGDKLRELGLMTDQPLKTVTSTGEIVDYRKPDLREVNKGKKLVCSYPYLGDNGEVLFEKLRYLNKDGSKTFQIRKTVGGQHFYKGVTRGLKRIPLYNQNKCLFHDTIYVVEGEKDCDTLQEHKLLGVTNYDGAVGAYTSKNKWKEYYSLPLKDKNVVIVADNDLPGIQHAQTVACKLFNVAKSVKVVRLDGLVPEHGDTTDFIVSKGITAFHELVAKAHVVTEKDVATWKEVPVLGDGAMLPAPTEVGSEDDSGDKKKQETPKALYDDYVALYKETLGDIKVDIFSEVPMYKDSRGYWTSVFNEVPTIRANAAFKESEAPQGDKRKFSRPLIEDYLHKYCRGIKPRFLVNIPQWDGVDRVNQFASCLQIHEAQGFSPTDVDNLITDWLVKAYRRLENPNTRNRVLVLKGKQNIGKDWWIDSLVHGAGQFAGPLSVNSGDKDTYLQLSKSMFLKISEFDRTSRMEVSMLKDLITTPYTEIRGAYERDSRRRYCRASFISSCNVDDILRDYTGSTRYIILDVTGIKYEYPVRSEADGLQILAQARALSDSWQIPQETEEVLQRYLEGMTPEDPMDILLDAFEEEVKKFLDSLSVTQNIEAIKDGYIKNIDFSSKGHIERLAKRLNINEQKLRNKLKTARIQKHTKKGKVFLIPQTLLASNVASFAETEEESGDTIPF